MEKINHDEIASGVIILISTLVTILMDKQFGYYYYLLLFFWLVTVFKDPIVVFLENLTEKINNINDKLRDNLNNKQ